MTNFTRGAVRRAMQQGGLAGRNRSNVGTRIFDGRTAATFAVDGVSGTTFHGVFRIAQDPEWIEPIFANGSTSVPFTIADWRASVVTDASDLNNNAGSWSLSGGSTVVGVARGAVRRKLVKGAQVVLPPRVRTDGGAETLVAIRGTIAAGAGSITILGNGANGTDDLTNWATRPDGILHAFRAQTGAHVSALTGFTSTANVSYCPIVGLRYGCKGRVITVWSFDDSIGSGRGTYKGDGFFYPAIRRVSNREKIAIEYACCAWAGANPTAIADHTRDAIADGFLPEIAFTPIGSPNVANAPLIDAHIEASRSMFASARAAVLEAGGIHIPRTWAATNPAQKDWNASDALRRALNREVMARLPAGEPVLDIATVLAGAIDADGQELMIDGGTSDNIHPNDWANALASNLVDPILRSFVG